MKAIHHSDQASTRLSGNRADLLSTVLLLGFFAAAMTQSAIPALSTVLREEMALSASEVGLLMSAYFVAYGILQIPAGALAAHWGGRVALAGFAALALGDVLLLTGGSFAAFAVARVLQGLGASVMLPTTGALSSAHIEVERLGRGWSITGMGAGIGNLFALTILARVATWQSLDWAFAAMLGVTAAAALLSAGLPEFRRLPRLRPAVPSPASVAGDVRKVLSSRGIALMVVINVAAISFGVGVLTWTPSYLHDVGGAPVAVAALLTAGYAVGQLAAAPLVGFLSRRLGNVQVLIGAFGGMIVCGAGFLLVSSPVPTLLLASLVGVCMTFSFAPTFALIPYHVEMKHAGLTSGVLSGIGFLGSMPTPWLVGLILDAGWGYGAGYGVLVAFALLGLVVSVTLLRVPPTHHLP